MRRKGAARVKAGRSVGRIEIEENDFKTNNLTRRPSSEKHANMRFDIRAIHKVSEIKKKLTFEYTKICL